MTAQVKRVLEVLRARRAGRATARVRQAGMTLLEIMIVLALIGLVMGSIGFGLNSYFKKGQKKTAKLHAQQIAAAAQQYMMENNSNCPQSLDDLVSNKNLQKKQTKDPWAKEFVMKCPGTNDSDGVDVYSTGPNKQDEQGEGDDEASWK